MLRWSFCCLLYTSPAIGSFATVTFYTARRDAALSVPTEAILTGSGDERYVFVIDEASGNTVVRTPVKTGLVSKSDTEIVSGLAEGDRVVVKGQSYLTDGSLVRIVGGERDVYKRQARLSRAFHETGRRNGLFSVLCALRAKGAAA